MAKGGSQTILTHPKYAGCIVFNRTSVRLKSKRVFNPHEQWIVQPNCFPATVSADTFERAQARFARKSFAEPIYSCLPICVSC